MVGQLLSSTAASCKSLMKCTTSQTQVREYSWDLLLIHFSTPSMV
ncbi:hypothetical protein SB48_HM08orf04679 [Heyndrickxia coagulans]|uniref:Uncharacterized protein n=1 Tax=Heyndrickxia coagulans TaxID=1398 RepID=A0AAN0T861_HEYCO|nr:hypothetical protein SB48_HM08orf04679 [Heyndrickxia coagulans]